MRHILALVACLSLLPAQGEGADEGQKFGDFLGVQAYETSKGIVRVARCVGTWARTEAEAVAAIKLREESSEFVKLHEYDKVIHEWIQLPNGRWVMGNPVMNIEGLVKHVGVYGDDLCLISSFKVYRYNSRKRELEQIVPGWRLHGHVAEVSVDKQSFIIKDDNLKTVGKIEYKNGSWGGQIGDKRIAAR